MKETDKKVEVFVTLSNEKKEVCTSGSFNFVLISPDYMEKIGRRKIPEDLVEQMKFHKL